ncbi:hypothetical protein ACSBR1_036714 [Camellia fascicularis]
MASLLLHTYTHTSARKKKIIDIDLSLFPEHDDDDDIQVLDSSLASDCSQRFIADYEICMEPKSFSDSFSMMGCTHSYCSNCSIKFMASKLQDNITQIQCLVPDCNGLGKEEGDRE